MKYIPIKGWLLVAISVILVSVYSNVHGEESEVAGQQAAQNLQPFKFYRIPVDASQINAAILGVIDGCHNCAQVEVPSWPNQRRYAALISTDECDLRSDLTQLSTQLGDTIEKIHEKNGWSTKELKSKQPKNCDLKILKYRIDIALQIMKTSLQ